MTSTATSIITLLGSPFSPKSKSSASSKPNPTSTSTTHDDGHDDDDDPVRLISSPVPAPSPSPSLPTVHEHRDPVPTPPNAPVDEPPLSRSRFTTPSRAHSFAFLPALLTKSASARDRVELGGNSLAAAAMREGNRSAPNVSSLAAQEVTARDHEEEVLNGHGTKDPYTWERPLDTVNRFSRMLDLPSPTSQSAAERRGSRLPPGLNVDPFGFGSVSESSPYDGALTYSAAMETPGTYSRSSTAFLSPPGSSSSMFTRSHSSNGIGPTSSAATSPVPWETGNGKARSASEGSHGAVRPQLRGSMLGANGRGSTSYGTMGPSKLSGEIGVESEAIPNVPTASSTSLPDVDFTKSRLYQRTLKAQKALEKERAKAAAKGQTLFPDDPLRNSRRGSTLSFLSETASISSEKKRVRKSLGWFRSASEVALPSTAVATPPLPSSQSVSQLPLYPHTVVTSNIPPSPSAGPSSRTTTPPASRNGSRSPLPSSPNGRKHPSPARSPGGRTNEEGVIAAANARRQNSLPVPGPQQPPHMSKSPSNLSTTSSYDRPGGSSSNGTSPQPSPSLPLPPPQQQQQQYHPNPTSIPLPDSKPNSPEPFSTPTSYNGGQVNGERERPPRNTSPLKHAHRPSQDQGQGQSRRMEEEQEREREDRRRAAVAAAEQAEQRRLFEQQQQQHHQMEQQRIAEQQRMEEQRRMEDQRRMHEQRQAHIEAERQREDEDRRRFEHQQQQQQQQRAMERPQDGQRTRESSWSENQGQRPYPQGQPLQMASSRQSPVKSAFNDPYSAFDHNLPPGAAPAHTPYDAYDNPPPSHDRPRKSSLNLLMGAFRKDSMESGSTPSPVRTSSNPNSPVTPTGPPPPSKKATVLARKDKDSSTGFFGRSKKAPVGSAPGMNGDARPLQAKVARSASPAGPIPTPNGRAPSTGDSSSTAASQKLVRKPKSSFFGTFSRSTKSDQSGSNDTSSHSSWSSTNGSLPLKGKMLPPPPLGGNNGAQESARWNSNANGGTRAQRPDEQMMAYSNGTAVNGVAAYSRA